MPGMEDRVMLELKANQALAPANEVQLVNYLTATRIELGLLLKHRGLCNQRDGPGGVY